MSTDASRPPGHGAGKGSGEQPPSVLEWILAAAGLILVAGSIAYLLHHASNFGDAAPAPAVRVSAIEEQHGRFVVRLDVVNQSKATAAALRLEGVLRRGAEIIERSETEFEYLPGGSSRQAGLYFSNDPRAFELEVAARSYQKP